jgi:hypothetical protein
MWFDASSDTERVLVAGATAYVALVAVVVRLRV